MRVFLALLLMCSIAVAADKPKRKSKVSKPPKTATELRDKQNDAIRQRYAAERKAEENAPRRPYVASPGANVGENGFYKKSADKIKPVKVKPVEVK